MVVIDSTFLLLFLNPNAPVPADENGVPVSKSKERIDLLIKELSSSKSRVLIPAPVLSEVMIQAGDRFIEVIEKIAKQSIFEIVPFDQAAAIEVAMIAKSELGKRKPDRVTTYAKLKYDRQIVATAKVRGATVIYSDDKGIKALCQRGDIKAVSLLDLPLPPEDPQPDMFKDESEL
jgi:predicted nucleic acid-binding protein